MKILTFYLPQYHRVKENDEWWGEGFTEWTNVKKAKPVTKGQTQPHVPLDNNYYDLMDKRTVEWQTDLMNRYGVYGFCYFHYWFTGRMILEKPAENLLKWKDINQRFCFAWANGTWARTWTANRTGNTEWATEDFEKKGSGSGILLEQLYGDEQDWINHYNYFREFFLDVRYVKEDNKPVLLIYQLDLIDRANEMFELWNKMAKDDGFDGIHIVSMNRKPVDNPYVEAVAMYANYSRYGQSFCASVYNAVVNKLRLPLPVIRNIFNYEKIWKAFVKEPPIENIKTYPAAVVNYDDTPRRGYDCIYLKNSTPEIFEKYLSLQIQKAKNVCHTDYIFMDAWNEWGEGNYLEPDEEHGYAYLEALKRAIERA